MTEMIFQSGTFTIGCNYWASHAGIRMWQDWSGDTVDRDFSRLAELGVEHLRIFPLWPDFQPLDRLFGARNTPRELVWKDGAPLPEDGSTVDPVMLARLRFVCDCAERHHLKILIALVTGWMSGRLFTPPAFRHCNLHTDPDAVFYQMRLVEEIIAALKDHPAIVMWESGNECNCLADSTRGEFRLWFHSITNAILAADSTRPVSAGLHGLLPASPGELRAVYSWLTGDVAQCSDFLTTHPYPAFTPYAGTDGLGTFKSLFHAVAENAFYGDIGGKPCFAEELGTLAPSVGCDETAGKYLKNVLLNLAFHDQRALYWWCAFDQNHLHYPPYTWCAVERQLGLFRSDGTVKPVGEAIRNFAAQKKTLPPLPPLQRDAVVILTSTEDAWRSAYGAYLLAAQAHFTPQFRFAGQPLPDAPLYLVPCVGTLDGIPAPLQDELENRVRNGATVLVTADDGMFSPLDEFFGVRSLGQESSEAVSNMCFDGEELPVVRRSRLLLESCGAEVLATDSDDVPVFTSHVLEKGHVFFCTLPLERQVAECTNATSRGYWKLYAKVSEAFMTGRPEQHASPFLTVTRHGTFVTLQNNGAEPVEVPPQFGCFSPLATGEFLIVGKMPH